MSDENDGTTANDPWIIQPKSGSTLSNLGIYLHIKNGLPYALYRIELQLRQGGNWKVIGVNADVNGAMQGSVDHIPLDVIRFYVTQVGNSYNTVSNVNLITPIPVFDRVIDVARFPGRLGISGYVPLNPGIAQMPAGAEYSVDIHGGTNGAFIENFPVARNGKWTATVDVPNGKRWFDARFNVKGLQQSDWVAQRIDVIGLAKPVINRPAQGIVESRTPTITGSNAYPGANIRILEDGQGGVLFGQALVAVDGTWSVNLTSALSKASINLTCEQVLLGVSSGWAQAQEFLVLPTPVVTAPTTVVDLRPTISGTTTGFANIQVDIYRDMTNEKIGQGVTTASGTWSAEFTQNLEPGVRTITAQLNYSGRLSTRSVPYNLTVRPEPPVISETVYYGTTTAFKGMGFPGATIEIHPNSGSPNATAVVNPQGYFETNAITLNPGTTGATWGARQKIANGSAWIFSAYHPIPPVFNVPTPVPTVNAPTLIGQIPSVTGRGSIWQGLAAAKIEVVLQGATDIALDQAAVTATGDWTATTTTAAPPGRYTVSVRQLMNGVYSLPVTAPASLIIKPLAPTVSSVVVEDFSPRIKGTCWPGASLSLTYTGETTHPVTSSNGNWEFRRDIKFKPGEHSFSVTQSFGGEDSLAAGPEKFKVETPQPEIISPVNQQETDFRPDIKGTNGYVGATVAVFDNKVEGPPLGQTTVELSGDWTVVLDKELTLGEHDIYARQTFETQASERSVSVLFNAMVPVPLFAISNPAHYPRRSKFSGSGLPGAQVLLNIDGVLQPGAFTVDANGKWEAEVYLPQVGNKTLVVTQKYAGGERSSISYAFTTVTNAPLIESPSGGESVDPDKVVVSGHGFPGDTVVVRESGAGQGDNIGQFLVNDAGFWSGPVKKLDGESDYKYWAYSTKGVIGGDASETAVVQLQTLEDPIIEHPSHADVLVSRLVFSGLGLPGAKIQVADLFNPETPLAPVTTVNEFGKWSVEGNTDFPAGPHWVIVQQSLGGKKSPWVRSGRFIIEEPPSGFMAPTLDAPLPGAQVGLEPMLAGRGVPGALVYVRHNGKELLQTWVDALGRWKARLPAFALGKQTLTVVQARYGVWSAPLSPEPTVEVIQVTDNFAAPTVESPASGSTVDMRFWVTGSGMAGAKVNVYKTNDGHTVYASAIVDAFGHWRACMSRDVPIGSFSFNAQQLLDGKASHYFAPNTIVTVAEQLPVPAFDNAPAGAQIAPVTRIHGTGFPGAKVVLHKSGDAATIWGEAEVDDEGYWVIWTNYLPLGLFTMTAKQVKGTLTSAWMPQRAFTVVNAG